MTAILSLPVSAPHEPQAGPDEARPTGWLNALTIDVEDYYHVLQHTIAPTVSHGKLGGKSSGLLLACTIVKRAGEYADAVGQVKVPRTWYMTSDAILSFIEHNQQHAGTKRNGDRYSRPTGHSIGKRRPRQMQQRQREDQQPCGRFPTPPACPQQGD